MQDTFHWSDSEVRTVIAPQGRNRRAVIVFSAARIDRRITVNSAPDHGFMRPLCFVIEQAGCNGLDAERLRDALGSVHHAELRLAQQPDRVQTSLPLPWRAVGPLRLLIAFRNGTELVIEGEDATCVPPEDARFHASFAC